MDPKKLFVDERLTGTCVYCGRKPATRDHVPSKVLLDDPFPNDLPVVPACEACNNSFSLDEEYLACLVEVAITGDVTPTILSREKIRRKLVEKPVLAARIEASCRKDKNGNVSWEPEITRIQNVLLKLARGHAAYEYSEPQIEEPEYCLFAPLCTMPAEQIQLFETAPVEHFWPEVGSRSFLRSVGADSEIVIDNGWKVVQKGRYRYLTSHSDGVLVRFVLSEYLACEVVW